jgi:hypothetical protein
LQFLANILQLPDRSLVNKRLTKVFFKRNFDLVLSEKKLLEDTSFIVQMDWLASLKPEQINVNAYKDLNLTFEEIQVITIQVNEEKLNKQSNKLIELIQKLIPYHLLLCVYNDDELVLSTAYKSINQNDSSKRVVNSSQVTEAINFKGPSENQLAFFESLVFDRLLKNDLKTLYESYFSAISALNISTVTGFYETRNVERSKDDVESLITINLLESEIIALQNQAKKETQLSTQVQINSKVQLIKKKLETLKMNLTN